MFETLEDAFEKSKPPLDRGLPILMYGIHVVISSTVLILGICRVRGRGLSHLFTLIVWVAMLLLSLTWLVTSFRSSVPITRYDYRVRYTILWVLLLLARFLPDITR
jgi:hypothetical protein